MSKPFIFCIVGNSGSGKTMAAEHVSKCLGLKIIRSYTTRPMRDGERDGIDHIFVNVDAMPDKKDMIAYTFFGGNHYWATKEQVSGDCLYVIDEDGVRMLAGKFGDEFTILPIYIRRKSLDGIDESRKARDMERKPLDCRAYVNTIDNMNKADMLFDIVSFVKLCMNNVNTFETWYKAHKSYMI